MLPLPPGAQGIVSIPGMMTGQILGGSDPATAARYQIVIMFLIGAATGLSAGEVWSGVVCGWVRATRSSSCS